MCNYDKSKTCHKPINHIIFETYKNLDEYDKHLQWNSAPDPRTIFNFLLTFNKNLFSQLREVDAEIGGVLALKDGQQDVRDFIAHYRLLDPEKNARNPWFKQYWEQVCCMGIPYANQFAQY